MSDTKRAGISYQPSGLEVLRLVEANIISIPEARRLLLGPEVSDYPTNGAAAPPASAPASDLTAAVRQAIDVLSAAVR